MSPDPHSQDTIWGSFNSFLFFIKRFINELKKNLIFPLRTIKTIENFVIFKISKMTGHIWTILLNCIVAEQGLKWLKYFVFILNLSFPLVLHSY